jgi:hypothetical protein
MQPDPRVRLGNVFVSQSKEDNMTTRNDTNDQINKSADAGRNATEEAAGPFLSLRAGEAQHLRRLRMSRR